MKKINLLLALISACAATSTFAVTGTITFNGTLVTSTCVAVVGGGGAAAADSTVTLPTLPVSALAAANATAGTKNFSITLQQDNGVAGFEVCDLVGGKAAIPYFEHEVARVNVDGRLKNTDPVTGASVDVQILNHAGAVINLSQDSATQLTSTDVAGVFNYNARYFATAAAVAGPVTASVSYSIIYK